MDVRGRAADEHAVVAGDDTVDASVANDGDDGVDCALARQHSADADQHTWRVQFTARLSGDVWECRDCGGEQDRGGFYRNRLSAGDVHRAGGADQGLIMVDSERQPSLAVRVFVFVGACRQRHPACFSPRLRMRVTLHSDQRFGPATAYRKWVTQNSPGARHGRQLDALECPIPRQ
jgi:hypothetical protein